jgi:hypothetical protein
LGRRAIFGRLQFLLLHCKISYAAMQTIVLLLASGIHILPRNRRCGNPPLSGKRGPYAQNGYPRGCTLPHAVRPPDGRDRPPADGQRRHRYSQRPSSLFWALKACCSARFPLSSNFRLRPKPHLRPPVFPGPSCLCQPTPLSARSGLKPRQMDTPATPTGRMTCALAYHIPICRPGNARLQNRKRTLGSKHVSEFAAAGVDRPP